MKVILLQDVRNLGRRWEIKNVPDGYGRNFLLAKKLAVQATPEHLAERDKYVTRDKKEVEQLKMAAQQLGQETIEFKVKTGKEGGVFNSIKEQDIKKELERRGYHAREIELKRSIKSIGEYQLEVNLGRGIKAAFKVRVLPS